jgi:hypothetical protein
LLGGGGTATTARLPTSRAVVMFEADLGQQVSHKVEHAIFLDVLR